MAKTTLARPWGLYGVVQGRDGDAADHHRTVGQRCAARVALARMSVP